MFGKEDRDLDVDYSWMLSVRLLLLSVLLAGFVTGAEVVRLCDVLRNPGKYRGKKLSITAGFRVGYEWQALACYDCAGVSGEPNEKREDPYLVWVEFSLDLRGASQASQSEGFRSTGKGHLPGDVRRARNLWASRWI